MLSSLILNLVRLGVSFTRGMVPERDIEGVRFHLEREEYPDFMYIWAWEEGGRIRAGRDNEGAIMASPVIDVRFRTWKDIGHRGSDVVRLTTDHDSTMGAVLSARVVFTEDIANPTNSVHVRPEHYHIIESAIFGETGPEVMDWLKEEGYVPH